MLGSIRKVLAIAAFSLGSLASVPLSAQSFSEALLNVAVTTPDMPVTATVTVNYRIPGGTVRFILIKNDCAKSLYFDLNGSGVYSVRLLQNQSFAGNFRVNTIGVSPDNTGTACTFTAVGAR